MSATVGGNCIPVKVLRFGTSLSYQALDVKYVENMLYDEVKMDKIKAFTIAPDTNAFISKR